jgi:hypothetical protein
MRALPGNKRVWRGFATLTLAAAVSAGVSGQALATPCGSAFAYTGAVATCTVGVAGTYAIDAIGASGGAGYYEGTTGGFGASAGGDFALSVGEILSFYVGGEGGTGLGDGGGGGGSFVVTGGGTVLAVGGGGGGDYTSGVNASLTTSGTNGAAAQGHPGLAGGTGGNGGAATSGSGGAGGGILGNGASGFAGTGATD